MHIYFCLSKFIKKEKKKERMMRCWKRKDKQVDNRVSKRICYTESAHRLKISDNLTQNKLRNSSYTTQPARLPLSLNTHI